MKIHLHTFLRIAAVENCKTKGYSCVLANPDISFGNRFNGFTYMDQLTEE